MCSPLNDKENKEKSIPCVHITGPKEVKVKHLHEKNYHLDGVFSAYTTQEEIYEQIGKPIIKEVLAGYSCTVFAYGQTGSGKTYTITGLNEKNISPIYNKSDEKSYGCVSFFICY